MLSQPQISSNFYSAHNAYRRTKNDKEQEKHKDLLCFWKTAEKQ